MLSVGLPWSPGLQALPPPLCGDEMVVLNEVVIDRGATASLTNLQVYVDQNFVTTIQVGGQVPALKPRRWDVVRMLCVMKSTVLVVVNLTLSRRYAVLLLGRRAGKAEASTWKVERRQPGAC